MADKKICEDKLCDVYLYEFRELSNDWRVRDGYVLQKLNSSGIIFSVIGLVLVQAKDNPYIQMGLSILGAFYCAIILLSILKDIHYRDGTEERLREYADHLGIYKEFNVPGSGAAFTRKIGYSFPANNPDNKKVPFYYNENIRPIYDNHSTFTLIVSFYLGCFLAFLSVLIYVSSPFFRVVIVLCLIRVGVFIWEKSGLSIRA